MYDDRLALPGPPPYSPLDDPAAARAQALGNAYGDLDAAALLDVMIGREFPGRIALISSFGAESAVLLDMVAGIDPATPVIFLDTGKLFGETLAYRDTLVARLRLIDVRSVRPAPLTLDTHDPDGDLWRRDPDACCALRKVAPLADALAGFDAWITGRKRYHGAQRTALDAIEAVDGRIKINPLADWSATRIEAEIAARGLPRHPLQELGYASIGCVTCTRRPLPGEAARDGRWAGLAKTECGIHRAPWCRPRGAGPGEPE